MRKLKKANLGKNIKKYRTYRDLTQKKLAEAAGFHYTYIGQVERGDIEPSFKALNKISEALGVGVDKLLINYELATESIIQISNITDLLLTRDQEELKMIFTLLKNLTYILDFRDIEKSE